MLELIFQAAVLGCEWSAPLKPNWRPPPPIPGSMTGAPSKPIPSHAANVGVWKIRPELRSGVKMQSVSGWHSRRLWSTSRVFSPAWRRRYIAVSWPCACGCLQATADRLALPNGRRHHGHPWLSSHRFRRVRRRAYLEIPEAVEMVKGAGPIRKGE